MVGDQGRKGIRAESLCRRVDGRGHKAAAMNGRKATRQRGGANQHPSPSGHSPVRTRVIRLARADQIAFAHALADPPAPNAKLLAGRGAASAPSGGPRRCRQAARHLRRECRDVAEVTGFQFAKNPSKIFRVHQFFASVSCGRHCPVQFFDEFSSGYLPLHQPLR
jgi:hypothetical protein